MNTPLRILHLEDDPLDSEMMHKRLRAAHFECAIHRVDSEPLFAAALRDGTFDLIVSDFSLPSYDGLSALRLARKHRPDIPFMFVSGTIGEERAIESLKEGAVDYIIKDRLGRLVPAVSRALKEAAELRQRQKAEEQVREQAALLDLAQDAICLNSMDQEILYWNRSAERLYGWTAKEALGRNANELLFQGDVNAPSAALKSLIRTGAWMGELNQVTKGDRKIVVESRWTLLRDGRGDPKSILVINTDITEKKQIEAQFLRTQRMETIGALAGGVAHDLNNALTPVLMGVPLIRNEVASEESRQMLRTMEAAARRGAEMVKQILSFARGVGGEQSILQVRHIIREMVKFAQDTFPRSIEIHTQIPNSIHPVRGNATQLHQVLLNLCVNARDAMPNGGRLSIETRNINTEEAAALSGQPVAEPYVAISVVDTGHGMSAETMRRIFEPFFTTKEIGKGTGLGLSTVVGIVKTHGGFVKVASTVGMGSSFNVYLPADVRVEAPVETASSPQLPQGRGEMILLVDDEAAILDVTRPLLEAFNFRVCTAANGVEAVEQYERHHSDIKVVVTDMMMPRMNGLETIHALRKINPGVKVIGVSGLGSETVLTKAGKMAANLFLRKPYTTEEFLVALQRLVREAVTV